MTSSAAAQESPAVQIARAYLQAHAAEWGLTPADIADVVVSSEVLSKHNRVTHVYLQQRNAGVPVAGALVNVNVSFFGHVIHAGNRFINLPPAPPAQPLQGAAEAAEAAARHLNLKPTRALQEVGRRSGVHSGTVLLSGGGVSRSPIAATLVYLPHDSGLRLAWRVEIEEESGLHWWSSYVDAESGEPLGDEDLIVHDDADDIASAIARPGRASRARPLERRSPEGAFPPTDGAVYNVFALPKESPNDGPRTLVSNAADPAASPLGWHDTGLPGGAFEVTRGNNAHAYTDIDANNVADPGSDPSGGSALLFDFPLDLSQGPPTYRPAAVTNLFYWNNIMHDVQYGYGFDEAAGNFQVNNFANGALGNDDVRAEAQDGSGTNNANFGTNVDGLRPRMQMFVWTNPRPNVTHVDSGPAAGDYPTSGAAFGPTFAATGPKTGTVVQALDGGDSPTDGCEAITNDLTGAIAIVDRGTCNFTVKVANSQAAGAIAVLVVNNVPGAASTLGGADPTILIPSGMVSQDHGTLIKNNLPVTATISADPNLGVNRDSDLDAGVIAHEYGHGVSNRLTGGPNVVGCLNNAEQMGEGWSDWQALFLTASSEDRVNTARGIGPYVVFQPSDGAGIRPTPYSTDMTVNPSTYISINNPAISQPHGIGYVWTTMLWEMQWNLIDRYGFNSDVYDPWFKGGNNLAHQLVTDGMKFQPCRPGFEDGRDAILAAERALTLGINQCEIWRAFAKRGMGFGADQGSPTDRFDGSQSFALPPECTAATFGGFQPPVRNAPTVNVVNAGSTVPLKFTLSGAPLLFVIDSQPVDCTTLVPTAEAPQLILPIGISRQGSKFHINWKTLRSWEDSCRRLTLRVPAATDPVAYFRFH